MTCIEFLRAIKDVAHVLDGMTQDELEAFLNLVEFGKNGYYDYLLFLDDGDSYMDVKTIVVQTRQDGNWGVASYPKVRGTWGKDFQRIVNAYAKEIADG